MAYRIIFAGTPAFSVAPLQALLDAGHEVIAVYTQPDRPAGRGRKLTASPVKQLALQHGLPIFQPESLKTAEAQVELAAHNADIMVVVAYGLILPQPILETPKLGCLNIHASLLPRWRGAAPIQRAIEAGDKETGITIMQMDVGLDTGDMLLKTHCPILPHDTTETLHEKLKTQGAQAIIDALKQLKQLAAEKQDNNQACYAAKLTKAEAKIDWSLSAEIIQRRIHAFNPWPMAFSELEGQNLRILSAQALEGPSHNNPGEIILLEKAGLDIACGKGLLRITQVQPAGKKPMSAYDFALSRDLIGQVFQ